MLCLVHVFIVSRSSPVVTSTGAVSPWCLQVHFKVTRGLQNLTYPT